MATAPGELKPHYVTLPQGQLRLWRTGTGPDLVALAGLTLGASVTARILGKVCTGWRITVIELPGIGGSSEAAGDGLDEIADALAAVITSCGLQHAALAAFELSAAALAPVLARLADAPAAAVAVGADRARAWAKRGLRCPALAPRQDGTHLVALWSHIRDCHLLEPSDPSQPAVAGEPLPSDDDLNETFVAVAVRPERYAGLWDACIAGMGAATADGGVIDAGLTDSLPQALAAIRAGTSPGVLPLTTALPDRQIWHDYVDTARGRVHLRRAGGEGRPLLVIPTGGGSSAQFAPVVSGLAQGRQVFAVDYLGNGLSDKPEREVSIGTLADDMVGVIDALGFDEIDVWGSHTGALVGLELAVRRPERVRRCVLEGPVFISPSFQSDILAKYFPRIEPDRWGRHLPLVWNWRRDMFMYWPWYRVERSAARQLGVPSAEELHKYALGILESGSHYDRAYRSAFAYDTRARLPLLTRPALICAGPNDMLVDGLAEAERLAVPGVEVRLTPTTVWWPDPEPKAAAETLALYDAFLSRP